MASNTRGATSVQVLLFSVLKEKLGCASLEVALEQGTTGGDLLDQLAGLYPAVHAHRSVIRLAVNAAYVKEDVLLAPGDEVALITPVSGG